MMGYTHALSGLAVGTAVAPLVSADAAGRVSFAVVAGGMALLPDWDQVSGTASGNWGPISRTVARLVGGVAGGHRAGTHDPVVAPVFFAALAWLAVHWHWGQVAVLAVAIGLGLRAVGATMPGRESWDWWPLNLAASWTAAYVAVERGGVVPGWMPVAVALGVAVHIAGDGLTKQGIPRPLSWIGGRPQRVAITGWSSGSSLLNWTAAAVSLATVFVLGAGQAGYDPITAVITAWEETR